ncbi:VanW family protein [Abyssisolibacter fermentans]|uniref:VanW family protein n=1 Tax=Abyssisolibacter fermentans TaxID=1766203 RepID=UPI0008314F4C|nr:VanW family protein [Abyssisolibacter fermentans]
MINKYSRIAKSKIKDYFPFLVHLKRMLHKKSYYKKMNNSKYIFAKNKMENELEYCVHKISQQMINYNSGYDLIYQKNKAHNLKILCSSMTDTIIYPGEVFSFWLLAKDADKEKPYKDGLILIDGEIKPSYGGGLCQMSNILYELFLHSPLTILERHTHKTKSFPPHEGEILGIDATVSEGYIDLKVKNETNHMFQVLTSTTGKDLVTELKCNFDINQKVKLYNKNLSYEVIEKDIHESVDVYKKVIDLNGTVLSDDFLYRNTCIIGYEMEVNK